jgi:hypothetical protein
MAESYQSRPLLPLQARLRPSDDPIEMVMDSTEAFRTLRLDPSADGAMVQNAYWTLVRQAQDRGQQDPDAHHEIDRLNEAYSMLRPGEQQFTPRAVAVRHDTPGPEAIDRAVNWLSDEALRTRIRWSDRNLEIAIIGGTALFLVIIALAAGTSFWLVALSAALIFAAIWAPWRRVHLPDPDDDARS